MAENPIPQIPKEPSFADFLQNTPPGEFRRISDAFVLLKKNLTSLGPAGLHVVLPAIEIYCPKCKGIRFADARTQAVAFGRGEVADLIADYYCRHCREHRKKFAITIQHIDNASGAANKVGELPLFGPVIPTELLALLGDQANLFEKGHRAESQGLGLGAFTYYRRVVEAQRTRIFDEIIAAAEHVHAGSPLIERLKKLRAHWRFQQSVDEIKDCLPQVLLIEGENPLELLHPVLSDAIHDRSDEEALEIASEIRLILANLAERLAFARSQSDELKSAVKRLVARKEQRGKQIQASDQGSLQSPPFATGKHSSGGGPATTPP